MTEPRSSLEGQIVELRSSLEEVQRRLAALEARLERGPMPAALYEAPYQTPPGLSLGPAATGVAAPSTLTVGEGLGLSGRVLLILGGGFLLRAITESGALTPAVGLTAGLLFALLWVYFADRAAGAGYRASAVAHGLAAALLGLPLVWETTVHFGFLSPWEAAAALTLITGLLLGVAWRRQLEALRWIAALGAVLAALFTLAGTRTAPPFAAFLLALGVATLWDDLRRPGPVLRWFTALAADLAIALVSVAAVAAPGRSPMAVVLALQLALPLLYVGCFGALDQRRWRPIDPFALIQSTAALLAGVGGAVAVVWGSGMLATGIGSLLLVLAAVGYLLAFRVVDRANRSSFHLFATAGMALLLAGSAILLPARSLLWSGLAVVSAWLAARFGRVSMLFQASLWVLAAGLAAGMAGLGFHAFAGPGPQTWPPFEPFAAVAGVAALLCLVLPRRGTLGATSPPARAAQLFFWTVLATSAAIALLYAGVRALPVLETDAGWLSVARTAVLAAVAVALAAAGQKAREARWLVYPALVAGGLKLLVEDLPHGRPGTLFLSFALVGSALILAARLLRNPAAEDASAPDEADEVLADETLTESGKANP